MAAKLQDMVGITHEDTWRVVAEIGIVAAALSVALEDDATDAHEERLALAGRVLRAPAQYADIFARPLLTVGAVATSASKADVDDIRNAVLALWTQVALAVDAAGVQV
jgi:hypothetical protein